MTVSIGRLRYDIVADTSQFTKGIVATRSELSLAKKMFEQSRTPAESFGIAVSKLDGLLTKGAIDIETHRRAVERLNAEYKQSAATVNKTASAFSGMAITMRDAVKAFVAYRVAGVAIGEVTGGFRLAAELETTAMNFEVLSGSASKAAKLVEDLRKYDAQTTFQFSDTVAAAQKLMNFGVAVDDVIPSLKALGDVSMGDSERLSRLALAFGQTTAAGKLMGSEVRQMVEAGFNPLQEIARQSGESMDQVRKRMEDGAVSAKEMADAFRSATSEGGRFFGMVEKRAETTAGQLDLLRGEWNMLKTEIAEQALPATRSLVTETREALKFWPDAYNKWLKSIDRYQGEKRLGDVNPVFEKTREEYEARVKAAEQKRAEAQWGMIESIGMSIFDKANQAVQGITGSENSYGAKDFWMNSLGNLVGDIQRSSRDELERIKQQEKSKPDTAKPIKVELAPTARRGSREEYQLLADIQNRNWNAEMSVQKQAQETRVGILDAVKMVVDAVKLIQMPEAI